MAIESGHLKDLFKPVFLKNILNATIRRVTELQAELGFNAIAFTGMSGAALAWAVSAHTGIPLICVRKRLDNTHYPERVEGEQDVTTYLILDDFIGTGRTVETIMDEIASSCHFGAKCVGVLVYLSTEAEKLGYRKYPVFSVCSTWGELRALEEVP